MRVTGIATRRQAAFSTALAALLACAVLLPLLGHKLLTEWDEGIYAEVSREMLGGSWWAPHWNYQLWFEKPPLSFWMTALWYKLFGVTEFTARANSALAGVASVTLVHGWLARRGDLLAAWLATGTLLGTFGFLHTCHVGEIDNLLTLCAMVSLVGWNKVRQSGHGGPGWGGLGWCGVDWGWLLCWAGFAAAVMAKGAAAVTIPLAVLLAAGLSRWSGERIAVLRPGFAAGVAAFAAITLPWHVAMYERFGPVFLEQYLGLHVLARATQQIEGHASSWWFYGLVLVVSAPPFLLLYPAALVRGFRHPEMRVWAVFAVVVVGFFTVVQTRLPNYIVPAYPALALLTGVWLGDWLRARLDRKPRSYWVGLGAVAVLIAVGAAFGTRPLVRQIHRTDLDSIVMADNKEDDELLLEARPQLPAVDGPLLLWREEPLQSIATVVLYARREVRQVRLEVLPPNVARNMYRFNPETLEQAVGAEPQLMLLDRALLPKLPAGLRFTPLRSSEHFVVGMVVRR